MTAPDAPAGAVVAVCVVHGLIPDTGGSLDETAIDKRPVDGPATVGALGIEGDSQCDTRHHGGEGQAVYAYAEADADWWVAELGKDLPPGSFGENLRLRGIDVTGAKLGEHWRIGTTLLEVTSPRIPCRTFQAFWDVPQLVKRFTQRGTPGAYLRVLTEGVISAGDTVQVVHRPEHEVTIGRALELLTTEQNQLTELAPAVESLPHKDQDRIRDRIAELSASPARR